MKSGSSSSIINSLKSLMKRGRHDVAEKMEELKYTHYNSCKSTTGMNR